MKTANSELRLVAIRAYKAGLPRRQICELVGYHLNTVNRWLREYEASSRIEPLAKGHRKSMFSQEELRQLEQIVESNPAITLQEIKNHFNKDCALSSIYNHIRRLGFGMRRCHVSKKGEEQGVTGCANGYYRMRERRSEQEAD